MKHVSVELKNFPIGLALLNHGIYYCFRLLPHKSFKYTYSYKFYAFTLFYGPLSNVMCMDRVFKQHPTILNLHFFTTAQGQRLGFFWLLCIAQDPSKHQLKSKFKDFANSKFESIYLDSRILKIGLIFAFRYDGGG